MRAAEHALRFLVRCGARYLFGIPGGTVNPFYDAMEDVEGIKPFMSRHEAAAAYTAASYAKQSGKLAVVVGSSGPGSSNLLTGVASAMRERTPLIVLTGQIQSARMGYGGAQEASPWTMDMVEAFRPFTKRSLLVTRAENLTQCLQQAIHLAYSHPQGPVHLSLPMDVQMGDVGDPPLPNPPVVWGPEGASPREIEALLDFLAEPGVIFAGSGIKKAHASHALVSLAERTGWKVVTTPAGKGSIPETHPLAMGVYGLAANQAAVQAVDRSERLLILGSSLGELGTSNWSPRLSEGKRLIQVDVDPSVLARHYELELGIVADLGPMLDHVLTRLSPRQWTAEPVPEDPVEGVLPVHLRHLADRLPSEAILCSDIGEHMTWALRYWKTRSADAFDITINYGGMGSGIANAIGRALAEPDRPVACLTGDGCFAMHGSEVLTALQYRLPVLFVVVNNASYGMVRWGHELQYGRSATDFDYPFFDVAKLAEAMGIPALKVDRLDDWRSLPPLLQAGPVVLEIIDRAEATPPMADRVKFLKGSAGLRLSFAADLAAEARDKAR